VQKGRSGITVAISLAQDGRHLERDFSHISSRSSSTMPRIFGNVPAASHAPDVKHYQRESVRHKKDKISTLLDFEYLS
jgi:hypothetical protein